MVLNLPNILTLSRLLLIPVFMYVLFADGFEMRWIAAVVFGVAAVSDWFDGYFARRLNQVTEFGKIADPVVDRILIASTVITLYIKLINIIPLWALLIMLSRDLLMVIGWLFLSRTGEKMAVTYLGKVSTAVLMTAFFLLFANLQLNSSALGMAGMWLFYTGMVLSLISGLNYLKSGTTILWSNQAKS